MSSNQMQEIMEMPREFVKDGTQFINRCTYVSINLPTCLPLQFFFATNTLANSKPDKREFLKISQAVGVGFLVMGVIGYIVKLSTLQLSSLLFFLSVLFSFSALV
jgi:protein transport protein SEC61 subunit gamma-like protein